MKTIVVYDQNTEKVAQAIGLSIGAIVLVVGDLDPADINGMEGPLKDGEIDRASQWAREVVGGCQQ